MFSSDSKIGDHEEKLFSAADIFVSACDAWNWQPSWDKKGN